MTASDSRPARDFAEEVVRKLRDAGFTAYFAGGCVRDQLLGLAPKDYDVATNAVPDRIRDLFGRRRTIAVGAAFGVITVVGPPSVGHIEVATFRSDGKYSDGRHPDRVTFSSPEEDARRRDFTINGMFLDPLADRVIDFVGGQADLRDKTVRAIGDPGQRIAEDRLRMLRAVRFAATYGFRLDADTLAAIRREHAHMAEVSQERITAELERMLVHAGRVRSLQLLTESELLPQVLPELEELPHQPEAWTRLLNVVGALQDPGLAVVLAALLGEVGAHVAGGGVELICRRLKVSNDARKAAVWMVRHEPQLRVAQHLRFSQLQPMLLHPQIEAVLELSTAVAQAKNQSTAGVAVCREKLQLPPAELDPRPLLNGADLAALGHCPGPAFAQTLQAIRNAQLDGCLDNREAALDMARNQLAGGT
jgi:tRNA nucleotidyltransferase/poly(A) polymerase